MNNYEVVQLRESQKRCQFVCSIDWSMESERYRKTVDRSEHRVIREREAGAETPDAGGCRAPRVLDSRRDNDRDVCRVKCEKKECDDESCLNETAQKTRTSR